MSTYDFVIMHDHEKFFDTALFDTKTYLDEKADLNALDFSRVLGLDFDGVLHPEHCGPEMEFCFMSNFAEALDYADPQGKLPIVITSSWRHTDSLEKMRRNFPEALRRQIIGTTPDLTAPMIPTGWADFSTDRNLRTRQREMETWMKRYAPQGKWLAVDDRPSWFSPNCPHLFAIPSFSVVHELGVGLNAMVVEDFKEKLVNFLYDIPQPKAARPA